MSEQDTKRSKFSDALKNGTGTVISRLIIIAMPFMAVGSLAMGKYIMELWGDRVLSGFERLEKRFDKYDQILDALQHDDISLDKRVTRVEDSVARIDTDRRPR